MRKSRRLEKTNSLTKTVTSVILRLSWHESLRMSQIKKINIFGYFAKKLILGKFFCYTVDLRNTNSYTKGRLLLIFKVARPLVR